MYRAMSAIVLGGLALGMIAATGYVVFYGPGMEPPDGRAPTQPLGTTTPPGGGMSPTDATNATTGVTATAGTSSPTPTGDGRR